MVEGHVLKAIEQLRLEFNSLVAEINRLEARRDQIEAGIEALMPLVAEVPETPRLELPVANLNELVLSKYPLWQLIHAALRAHGPMSTFALARLLRDSGYNTSSGNFPNVIVTTLGARKSMFERLEDGKWAIRSRIEEDLPT